MPRNATDSVFPSRLTPGPWYSLPWYVKGYRWVRYVPAFKVVQLFWHLRYLSMWYRGKRHLPLHQGGPERWDGRYLWPNPAVNWELTVRQDPAQLERYFTLNPRQED